MMPRLALLTRHFLRRYLDNDLVSPGGDSHVGVSHALAAFVVPGLMVVMLVTLKYSQYRLTWAEVADRSFDDAAFCVSMAMILFGMAATVTWDAFYLDSRDQVVFGSLPVPPRLLALAKLAALGGFLGVFTLAAHAIPALLVPPLMLRPVRDASAGQLLALYAGHAASSVGAGIWAVLAVVAIRGVLGWLLPGRLFRRASPLAQGTLVLLILGWFMSLPQFLFSFRGLWQAGGWVRDALPPFWFVGLHQAIVGRADPSFASMARVAVLATGTTTALVILLFLVRPPRRQFSGEPSAFIAVTGRSLASRVVASVARLAFPRRSLERATFQFTMESLGRSSMHRLYLAAAAGAGLAWAAGGVLWSANELFWQGTMPGRAGGFDPTPTTLQAQFILTLLLVTAVRFAVTVPISLNANWLFRITEREPVQRYHVGTRRAALAVGLLPVFVLAPVHARLWGAAGAGYHALVGACYAVAVVELFFNACAKLPFAAPYISGSVRLKTRWLLYVFGASALTAGPAHLESLLLGSGTRMLTLPLLLLGAAVAMALGRRRRERQYPFLLFDEAPIDSFQTLAIND
jgi:hypothetical protein